MQKMKSGQVKAASSSIPNISHYYASESENFIQLRNC